MSKRGAAALVLLSALTIGSCRAGVGTGAVTHEDPPVYLGRRLAAKEGIRPGDRVTLALRADDTAPDTFRVAGTFEDPADPAEISERPDYVRMQLPDLDRVAGLDGEVDRIAVRLADPARAREMADQLNAMSYGFRAHAADDLAEQASRSFVVIRRFHVAISVITIFGGGVFVMAIMLLKVEELKRELMILRLIGISSRTIVRSLMLEALLLTAAGSAVAIGLGIVLSLVVNAYYRAFYGTTLTFSQVTPGIVLLSVAVSAGLGLAAGAISAVRLSRRAPLEVLGH